MRSVAGYLFLFGLIFGSEGLRKGMTSKRHQNGAPCQVAFGLSLGFQRNPLPVDVAARRIRELGVTCVRLWHYEPSYLQALLDAGIWDVLVNVPTFRLRELSSGMSLANEVANILKHFHSQGMRFRVAVGNEPLASWEGGDLNSQFLLPGMQNMHAALQQKGLTDVTTTVAFYNGVMGVGYPPQAGAFVPALASTINDVAEFSYQTGGEFLIHIYPYFAVAFDPNVPMDLALGKVNNTIDGITYSGLLHQQIAATRAALVALNPKFRTLPMSIGECGWPTQEHWAATTENAATFTNHVIREFSKMDPHLRTMYLFEAFDEQLKSSAGHGGPGAKTEDHFGVMFENGTLKYDVAF